VEAAAAVTACAEASDLPIWVAWTLKEEVHVDEKNTSKACLRSSESLPTAWEAVSGYKERIEACLFNCTSWEACAAGVRELTTLGLLSKTSKTSVTSIASCSMTASDDGSSPVHGESPDESDGGESASHGELREADRESTTPIPPHIRFGAYANGFVTASEGCGDYADLSGDEFCVHVEDWVNHGATIVGGCCGVFPHHIHTISERMKNIQHHRNSDVLMMDCGPPPMCNALCGARDVAALSGRVILWIRSLNLSCRLHVLFQQVYRMIVSRVGLEHFAAALVCV